MDYTLSFMTLSYLFSRPLFLVSTKNDCEQNGKFFQYELQKMALILDLYSWNLNYIICHPFLDDHES